MRYLSIVLEKLEPRKQVNLKNYGGKHMTIQEAKRAAGIIEWRQLIYERQQGGQSVSAWRPCSAYCLSAQSRTRTLRLVICSHGQKNEVVVLGSVSAGNAAFDQRAWGCGVVSRRGGHRIGCSAGDCFSGESG